MTKSPPLLLALLALCLASPRVAAQAPPKCYKCNGAKVVPCTNKAHDPKRVCGITIPHRCSAVAAAPCCRGLGKVLCERCNSAVAEIELKEELDARASWLERMRSFDKKTAITFAHVETDHFVLHWSLPVWQANLTSYNRDKAAHLYAERLEKVAARFQEIFGALPAQRQTVFLVAGSGESMKVTLEYQGRGIENGLKTRSDSCIWTTRPKAPELDDDEELHAHFVHHGTHLLTEATHGFDDKFPDWFDVGLAHWMEHDFFDESRNWCFNETPAKNNWQEGSWPKKIFSEFRTGRAEDISKIAPLGLERLDPRLHVHCWAAVDFLIKQDPEKIKAFFRSLKGSNDTRKAVDETYNMSMSGFQEAWQAYILKTYGT